MIPLTNYDYSEGGQGSVVINYPDRYIYIYRYRYRYLGLWDYNGIIKWDYIYIYIIHPGGMR